MATGFCILSPSLSGWNKYLHLQVENWIKFSQLKESDGFFCFTESEAEQPRKMGVFKKKKKKKN